MGWINEKVGFKEDLVKKQEWRGVGVKRAIPVYSKAMKWSKTDGAFPIPEGTAQHFHGSGRFVGCETQSGRVCLVLSEDAVYWFVYSLSEAYLR